MDVSARYRNVSAVIFGILDLSRPYCAKIVALAADPKMDALIKKGVHFAVCQMSTRGIAGRIARANGADTDGIVKEITANLIGNAHMVPAGILAVNRAQERGYSFIYAI